MIYPVQNSESALCEIVQFNRVMRIQLERDKDGRVHLGKGRNGNGRVDKKLLAAGVALCFGVVVIAGAQAVLASGDNNCWNWGEEGMYEENNNNDFPDYEFPGDADQLRGGVVWPDESEEL